MWSIACAVLVVVSEVGVRPTVNILYPASCVLLGILCCNNCKLVVLVILKVCKHIWLEKFGFGINDKSLSHLGAGWEILQSVLAKFNCLGLRLNLAWIMDLSWRYSR